MTEESVQKELIQFARRAYSNGDRACDSFAKIEAPFSIPIIKRRLFLAIQTSAVSKVMGLLKAYSTWEVENAVGGDQRPISSTVRDVSVAKSKKSFQI